MAYDGPSRSVLEAVWRENQRGFQGDPEIGKDLGFDAELDLAVLLIAPQTIRTIEETHHMAPHPGVSDRAMTAPDAAGNYAGIRRYGRVTNGDTLVPARAR